MLWNKSKYTGWDRKQCWGLCPNRTEWPQMTSMRKFYSTELKEKEQGRNNSWGGHWMCTALKQDRATQVLREGEVHIGWHSSLRRERNWDEVQKTVQGQSRHGFGHMARSWPFVQIKYSSHHSSKGVKVCSSPTCYSSQTPSHDCLLEEEINGKRTMLLYIVSGICISMRCYNGVTGKQNAKICLNIICLKLFMLTHTKSINIVWRWKRTEHRHSILFP